METDENMYKVTPQLSGGNAHSATNNRSSTTRKDDISIAKQIVLNKVVNQRNNLIKTRKKDNLTRNAISYCDAAINSVDNITNYEQLMGLEGTISKHYFSAYFQTLKWQGRHPRIKSDIINVAMDIGYTILFNYMECFLKMFGFDVYVGIYHRLWFKHKSLVCDLIEPFRCIIDHTILLAFHRGEFKEKDFIKSKHIYELQNDKYSAYYRVFYNALIEYKSDFFKFVQQYYRCFMGCKSVHQYPTFNYK